MWSKVNDIHSKNAHEQIESFQLNTCECILNIRSTRTYHVECVVRKKLRELMGNFVGNQAITKKKIEQKNECISYWISLGATRERYKKKIEKKKWKKKNCANTDKLSSH